MVSVVLSASSRGIPWNCTDRETDLGGGGARLTGSSLGWRGSCKHAFAFSPFGRTAHLHVPSVYKLSKSTSETRVVDDVSSCAATDWVFRALHQTAQGVPPVPCTMQMPCNP